MTTFRTILFLAMGCVLLGCSRQEGGGVVVSVDGCALTVAALDECCETALAFLKHRFPKMSEQDVAQFRKKFQRQYPRQFVRDTVLARYAAQERLVVTETALQTGRKAVLRAYRRTGDKKFDDLIGSLKVSRAAVDRQIRMEVTERLVKDHLVALAPTNFTADYAACEIRKMHRYNADMALTNALVFAHATNVWNMLRQGSNFVATADAFTELPDDRGGNCEWGAFPAEALNREYPEVRDALKNLSPGMFTPPLESDNGLVILHYDGRDAESRFVLSRIFFRLPLLLEIPTQEGLLKNARRDYREDLFKRKVKELIAEAKVQYFKRSTDKKEKP